jgi:hypothetical protein
VDAQAALGGGDEDVFQVHFEGGGHLEGDFVGLRVGEVGFGDDGDDG